MDDDATLIELGRAVLAAQPFNDLVGACLERFDENGAELVLEIADRHRQQYGLVHGGVLAYLVDNAVTYAAAGVLGTSVITSGVTVSYLRGARDGVLHARASVAHGGSGVAVARAEVVCVDGAQERLVAVGQGTVVATRERDS